MWTIQNQLEAMRRNIFVKPEPSGQASIVSLGKTMDEVKSQIARDVFRGDEFAIYLVEFIRNPDQWSDLARTIETMRAPLAEERARRLKGSFTRAFNKALSPAQRVLHDQARAITERRNTALIKLDDLKSEHMIHERELAKMLELRNRMSADIAHTRHILERSEKELVEIGEKIAQTNQDSS